MQADNLESSLNQMKAAHAAGHDPCDCLDADQLASVNGRIAFYRERADMLDALPLAVPSPDGCCVLCERYPAE